MGLFVIWASPRLHYSVCSTAHVGTLWNIKVHFSHFSLCSFLWRYIVNQTNSADILLCVRGAVGFLPTCCGLVGWGFYCIFALGTYWKMVMMRIEMVVVWRRLYLIFAFGNYGILWQAQCGQHLFTPSFSKRTYYKPKPSFQSNKPFANQKMVVQRWPITINKWPSSCC